jgi:vanillate/3-O-methylgallate O-demethylase
VSDLDEEIRAAGGPLELMRSGRSGSFPFPIRAEFTNWRDEQESWRTSAALMDLSHHMTDLTVEGPDCYRLLSALGANSFAGFGPMKAKQFIAVGYDGHMVGDCILFCLAGNLVRLVGRPPALNWVDFHAQTGGYDVTTRRGERTVSNARGREMFRLQLQGPNAGPIFEKVNGGPMPGIPFFHMGTFHVGKYEVTALNHRMSGFPGLSWHRDDVARIFASMYEPGGQRFKYIDMPAAFYAGAHGDRVEQNGQLIGVSKLCCYSSNVRGWISVAMIDEDDLAYGEEVELVWGEPDGGSANPLVERHTQIFWDKR